jgi:hypothetical protein
MIKMKKHLCEKDYVLIIVQIGYLLLFLRTFFFYTCFVYVHSIERLCKYNCNNLMTFRIYLMKEIILYLKL